VYSLVLCRFGSSATGFNFSLGFAMFQLSFTFGGGRHQRSFP